MSTSFGSRNSVFYLIVFIYIVSSFLYWTYLLHKNNYDDFTQLKARELNVYLHQGGNPDNFANSEMYQRLYSDYRQKEAMLIGEGTIFIILMSIGFWRIRRLFREEIILTRQQNNFLLSITHELKSPLASLKLSMQTMEKHRLDADQVKKMAHMSMDDVDRLESLVENILLASKIESSNFRLNKEEMNLSEITRNIYERICEKFRNSRTFESNIVSNIYVKADRLSFSSVIYNLIENAIKYSTEGSLIQVDLRADAQSAILVVSDTGIGIPDHEKARIFERFYRVGREETRTTKGTGLGLFIVKQIVAYHDGTIEVRNNQPKGSVFTVSIPLV